MLPLWFVRNKVISPPAPWGSCSLLSASLHVNRKARPPGAGRHDGVGVCVGCLCEVYVCVCVYVRYMCVLGVYVKYSPT